MPEGDSGSNADLYPHGKGFGKPDGNHEHWRVIVSYDC